MRLYSLRKSMLSAIIVPLILVVCAMAASAIWVTQRSVALLLDDQMQQEASFLLLLARHEATEGESLDLIRTVQSEDFNRLLGVQTGFRIWSADNVVTQSDKMPAASVAPPPGFVDKQVGGASWRTFAVRYSDLPVTVEIGQSGHLRRAFVDQIICSLVVPLLCLIVAVAVITHCQINAAMRPMRRISAQIDRRDENDLERLSGHRIPAEVAPLFDAFNRLIDRMKRAIDREREFADNAAHELRTPLAALKARAQIVARDLADDPERQRAARQLVAATDRTTGVIDQLLVLGRLGANDAPRRAIDMSQLVEQVARELAPSAVAKAQVFGVDIAPTIIVPGQLEALMMLVRNLIDNAVRYTPAGGTIEITLSHDPDGNANFSVRDSGPGIPEGSEHAILERFTRLHSSEPGSGLGLSIAQQIAMRLAGCLTITNRAPHGLTATVTLPIENLGSV